MRKYKQVIIIRLMGEYLHIYSAKKISEYINSFEIAVFARIATGA